MRGAVSLFACAVCIAYLLAPTKAHTEIAERPNTPLVSVLEIGPNWVTIQACCLGSKYNFGGQNQEFVNQAYILGNYVCLLNDREGVLLTELSDGAGANLRIYYLVACAIP